MVRLAAGPVVHDFSPISYILAEKMKVVVQRTGAAYKEQSGVLSAATMDRASNALTYRIFGREQDRQHAYKRELESYENAARQGQYLELLSAPHLQGHLHGGRRLQAPQHPGGGVELQPGACLRAAGPTTTAVRLYPLRAEADAGRPVGKPESGGPGLRYVPETLHNIRTSHSLGKEGYMEQRYDRAIGESYRAIVILLSAASGSFWSRTNCPRSPPPQ